MVDLTPSDMDDLLGIGVPTSGSSAQHPATASVPVSAAPAAAQYSSRRAQRDAEATASAALPKRRTSEPASRKLRRADAAAIKPAAPKAPRKHPVSVLATMTVVCGLFAVAALPAYALGTANNDAAAASVNSAGGAVMDSQSVAVSKDAVATPLSRDGYRATTPEQLAEMTRDDVRSQNTADYLASGARQQGDDYPWYYELADYQGGGLSPLNYYYRQCTDFVAWRLNRDAGALDAPYAYVWSNLTPSGGNASQWKAAWDNQGWKSSSAPIVGSVAWFGTSANHVAYVKAVLPDGNIVIEEYNWVPSVYSQRTIPASSVASFLYPPTYKG